MHRLRLGFALVTALTAAAANAQVSLNSVRVVAKTGTRWQADSFTVLDTKTFDDPLTLRAARQSFETVKR